MPFLQLTGGAYQTRSLIAAAQRCLNLYVEATPQAQGEPIQYAHYCTPGLTLQATWSHDICRGLYQASTGDLWAVYDQQLLWVDSSNVWHQVGTLTPSQPSDATPHYNPVSMVDNGTKLIVVDGSVDGWTCNVVTHDGFARIDYTQDAYSGWYGSPFITYQDTFFIASKPNTSIFYVSGSEDITWDAIDFASAVGQAGYLQGAISVHRTLWLIGTNSYEVWINNGGSGTAADSFPFSIYPEAFGNWGCVARYSIATILNQIFWLSQDKYGHALVMHGEALQAKRASTYAIEYQISQYPKIDDAIGYTYQQYGHVFYVLTFPSAHSDRGATWVFDSASNEWHERAYIDNNGIEYRHLSNACAAAYGQVYCGDWRNGNLYTFDNNNYTDNGQPIKRLRSFPHEIDLQANRRIMYTQAIAQMQVGTASASDATTQRVISTDFTATDGTLLQDFSDPNSIGALFTKIGSVNGVILSDALTATASGNVLYEASGTPISADYFVQFNTVPDRYDTVPGNGAKLDVIGRADGSDNGYQAGISSDGSAYSAYLTVMGHGTTTVAAGTLDSGYYTVTLSMTSTSITVSVLRSADGLWLNSAGSWVGSQVTAIAIQDSVYTLPGRILVGGTWV